MRSALSPPLTVEASLESQPLQPLLLRMRLLEYQVEPHPLSGADACSDVSLVSSFPQHQSLSQNIETFLSILEKKDTERVFLKYG